MNEPKYVVVTNRGTSQKDIFYCGDSEILAFKRLKELKYPNKEIVRATVKMVTMFGYELIERIDVIEKII